jgi:ribosome-binding protein aMBF1 (putative translation factor)
MRIELQWAFTDADIPRKPCALCEIEFEGEAVIIRCDPHSYEVCEDCLRALDGRKEQEDGAPWPSWAEYEDLVESHPAPMFESDEAMDAAGDHEAEDPERRIYEESLLWRPERSRA